MGTYRVQFEVVDGGVSPLGGSTLKSQLRACNTRSRKRKRLQSETTGRTLSLRGSSRVSVLLRAGVHPNHVRIAVAPNHSDQIAHLLESYGLVAVLRPLANAAGAAALRVRLDRGDEATAAVWERTATYLDRVADHKVVRGCPVP